jgi:hypothetical protein
MKTQNSGSFCRANGTEMRKSAAETSTTASASRCSFSVGAAVEGKGRASGRLSGEAAVAGSSLGAYRSCDQARKAFKLGMRLMLRSLT